MRFTGKHGIVHEVPITDSNLKRIVAKCDDLPGQHLFQYITEDGEPCPITSADVNDYIREAIGRRFHRQELPHLGRERHRVRPDADGARA